MDNIGTTEDDEEIQAIQAKNSENVPEKLKELFDLNIGSLELPETTVKFVDMFKEKNIIVLALLRHFGM